MGVVKVTAATLRSLHKTIMNLDQSLIASMAQTHDRHPPLDRFATFVASYAPHLYALGFIGAWYGLDPDDLDGRSMIVRSVIAGGASVVVARSIAQLFPRTRPFAVSGAAIAGLIDHRPSHSFPSTHSAGATAFVVGLGPKPAGLSMLFRPLTIGVLASRIYSGVHWPTDVGAGMLVGVGLGYFTRAFIPDSWQSKLTAHIVGVTPMLR